MNELCTCRFSQNKHPTSPALKLEAGTWCLQSQPTWDLCGPPKPHFSRLPVPVARRTQTCGSLSCQILLLIVWMKILIRSSFQYEFKKKIRLECLSLAGLRWRSMRIAIAERKNSKSGSQEIRLEAVPACHIGTLQIRSHILFGDKVSVFHHEAHWISTKDHQLTIMQSEALLIDFG